jgi:hypothetical protein
VSKLWEFQYDSDLPSITPDMMGFTRLPHSFLQFNEARPSGNPKAADSPLVAHRISSGSSIPRFVWRTVLGKLTRSLRMGRLTVIWRRHVPSSSTENEMATHCQSRWRGMEHLTFSITLSLSSHLVFFCTTKVVPLFGAKIGGNPTQQLHTGLGRS